MGEWVLAMVDGELVQAVSKALEGFPGHWGVHMKVSRSVTASRAGGHPLYFGERPGWSQIITGMLMALEARKGGCGRM